MNVTVPSGPNLRSSAASIGAGPVRDGVRAPKPPAALRPYLSLHDFDVAARRFLPRMLYGFVSGGTESGTALRRSLESFDRYSLVPRVLVDTSARTQETTLMGRSYAVPFGIAPMGMSALIAYRGDTELGRAAVASRLPMILSASSLIRLEDVRETGIDWFQAYLPGDTSRIDALVDRVAAAGYETFVLTGDVPVPSNRENNVRNGFSVPLEPTLRLAWDGITHPGWLFNTWLKTFRHHGMPYFENLDATRGPAILSRDVVRAVGPRDRLSWEHFTRIRRRWPGKLVLKGVLSPADAILAREAGADGIIVSSHGGRQLDHAIAPLHALPAIKAASGDMAVMMEGGIRRGTDVLKALALGADFVFIGRPFLYAAALGGAPFIRHAASLLSLEIDRDMALLGISDLAALTPEVLATH